MTADKKKVLTLLKTARGQLDGLVKMVEDDRYCIDISNQIMAANSILKNANREILASHLENCVKEAMGGADAEEKIGEVTQVIHKLLKGV